MYFPILISIGLVMNVAGASPATDPSSWQNATGTLSCLRCKPISSTKAGLTRHLVQPESRRVISFPCALMRGTLVLLVQSPVSQSDLPRDHCLLLPKLFGSLVGVPALSEGVNFTTSIHFRAVSRSLVASFPCFLVGPIMSFLLGCASDKWQSAACCPSFPHLKQPVEHQRGLCSLSRGFGVSLLSVVRGLLHL